MRTFFKRLTSVFPNFIKYRVRQLYLGFRLVTYSKSYLVNIGHVKSYIQEKPIDKEGNPLPWMNYSFINLIKDRLNKSMKIFEYGSGYSSLFFAKHVEKIISIEYDKNWFDLIGKTLNEIPNLDLQYYPLNESYPKSIHENKEMNGYDIIIVDGRKRVDCALEAYEALSKNGVLILDDSYRDRYQKVFDFYKEKGFKEITIKGLKPTGLTMDITTVFYRANQNCLNF